ncbi:CD209 antigen-like protein E isoform X19 [Epinephelus fuscoguttatus]|uniref:CD209 antigen-like protein E isoform X19 n=1 Tax=Epinephelus fuscoguttatus TaxID=293821 RepID=UPI0020D0ADC2|nr:CD209 antigen-like protein E isoform X19 [Epinephelus fuscoguttatus]
MAAAMAEEQEGVNYASVVFKANKHPPSEGKTEETVYDEVKVQNGTTDQAADAGFLEDKRANNRRRHFKRLACGLGIIAVILLAGIIAVCVYKNKITNLTEEILKLTTQNQELKSQKNNLTEQIQEMKANINVSRAQWSIDAYCPKENNKRRCKACQKNWEHKELSCYIIHNAIRPERITWKEALENCRGKNSDLAVIHDEEEKKVINDYSWDSSGINGYWIGLRAEDKKWKWIDGSDLAESSWIDPPAEGHCAISVKNDGWKTVSCDEKQRWICRQKALSV